MESNLTQEQIASMSHVLAKYMGWDNKNGKTSNFPFYSSWDYKHEIYTQLIEDKFITTIDSLNNIRKYGKLFFKVRTSFADNNPLEAFTALYNAIEFINQLKQEKINLCT